MKLHESLTTLDIVALEFKPTIIDGSIKKIKINLQHGEEKRKKGFDGNFDKASQMPHYLGHCRVGVRNYYFQLDHKKIIIVKIEKR